MIDILWNYLESSSTYMVPKPFKLDETDYSIYNMEFPTDHDTLKWLFMLTKIWKNVSLWRHQMETFSALLVLLCGEFTEGQWRGALMFPLICARLNACVNNREAGDLRRHRTHYDIIVIIILYNVAYLAYNHHRNSHKAVSKHIWHFRSIFQLN